MEQAENLTTFEDNSGETISKYRPYKVDKDQAFLMALKGVPFTEIGKHFGVTHSAISHLLAKRRDAIRAYLAYKDNVDTLYDLKAVETLIALTPDKIKKMSGDRLILSACQATDKARLIRGQATSINATATFELTEAGYKDLIASKYTQTEDLLIGNQQPTTQQTVAAQGKAALPKAQGDGPGDGPPAKRARAAKHAAASKPAARKAGQP